MLLLKRAGFLKEFSNNCDKNTKNQQKIKKYWFLFEFLKNLFDQSRWKLLYPTLNQPLVLLIILGVGFLSGFLFDIANIMTTLSGNDKLSRHIFDFIATIFAFLLLFFANLYINFGQFRIYVFLIFILSLSLERFISKILWTKVINKLYTSIMKRRKTKVEKKVDWNSVVVWVGNLDTCSCDYFNDFAC